MAFEHTIPEQVANVEAEVVGDEMVLYHPQSSNAVYLNATAALIWGLCDGRRSVREIVGLIENTYPDAGPALIDDVGAVVDQLQGSGVIVVR